MKLSHTAEYREYGLSSAAQAGLTALGDLLLGAGLNVTAVKDPEEIEKLHFLDSLALLRLPAVRTAERLADVGSGGGLPALVLALALPGIEVAAVESVGKKCEYIERAADALGLSNVQVYCARVEDYARAEGRESYDVVVSRAVASLPVLVEYSIPLLRVGGTMVAMKGAVPDQERTQAAAALGILGGDEMEAVRSDSFPGSRDRWVYVAKKTRPTPDAYPRRAGVPQKRPLGTSSSQPKREARP